MSERILFFTCAYNAEGTLRRAMDSIVNQTHENWVYYVLDNGSTDSTGDIIREYEQRDSRIHGLRVENNDVANLFYTPFRKNDLLPDVEYDYMAILDADDEYMPEFSNAALSYARENMLDLVVVCYDNDACPGDNALKGYNNRLFSTSDDYSDLPSWHKIIRPVWAKLYHRSLLNKLHKERITLHNFEVSLEAIQRSDRMGILWKILHRFHLSGNNHSRKWDSSGAGSYKYKAVDLYDSYYRFMKEKCGSINRRNADMIYYIYAVILRAYIEILDNAETLGYSEKKAILSEMIMYERTQMLLDREDFGSEMNDPGICLDARANLLRSAANLLCGKSRIDIESSSLLVEFYQDLIKKHFKTNGQSPRFDHNPRL